MALATINFVTLLTLLFCGCGCVDDIVAARVKLVRLCWDTSTRLLELSGSYMVCASDADVI